MSLDTNKKEKTKREKFKMKSQKVNLISGGLDSFVLWYLFCRDAKNVFVMINHKYQKKELKIVKELNECIPNFNLIIHKGSDIGKFEDEKSGIIPNRNAELILSASEYGNHIYMGVLKNEINSDKSPEFIKAMTEVLDISNKKQYWTEGTKFKILTPTKKYTKTQLIQKYLKEGGNPELLNKTVSCYHSKYRQCGQCPSCFKRFIAYINNDLKFESKNNPIEWAEKNGIFKKCFDGTYNKERSNEILRAMKKLNYKIKK